MVMGEYVPGTIFKCLFPELYRLDSGHPFVEIHALVGEACAELGIPVLDLFAAAFRGRNPKALWVHPSDHHPNARAHRLAGEALAGFVREELALP
jgi:lysophospholipase L1-like esterase